MKNVKQTFHWFAWKNEDRFDGQGYTLSCHVFEDGKFSYTKDRRHYDGEGAKEAAIGQALLNNGQLVKDGLYAHG